MFGKRSVLALPPRNPHPNSLIESRLQQIDLLRLRVLEKQAQLGAYHKESNRLLQKIANNPGYASDYKQGIGSAADQIEELEADISEIMAEIDRQQTAAEDAEARALINMSQSHQPPQLPS